MANLNLGRDPAGPTTPAGKGRLQLLRPGPESRPVSRLMIEDDEDFVAIATSISCTVVIYTLSQAIKFGVTWLG
jgi:hypothetical protein